MIYYILVPTILFMPLLTTKLKFGKNLYFFVVTSLLVYFAGFRHWSVGVDTNSYVNTFLNSDTIDSLSLGNLLTQPEYLHVIYRTVIRHFTNNYLWYLLPVSIFYICVTSRFIYKHSPYPSISFLAFLSMSYYAFSMTGIRQTICYGFLVLAADAFLSRKRILSLVFIFLAAGFHTTGWLFLSIFLIEVIPFGFTFIGFSFLLCAIAYLRASVFIQLFLNLLDKSEGYLDYEAGSPVILMVIIFVSIAAILFHPKLFEKTKLETNPQGKLAKTDAHIDQFFVKLLLLSIPILVVSLFQANIFRIAAMFHFYMIVLIPRVLKSQQDAYVQVLGKIIVYAMLLTELFIFTFNAAGVFPYRFS